MQFPGGCVNACDPVAPATTATAQNPFRHHQGQDDDKRDQSQADRPGGIPLRLPGLKDSG